MREHLDGKKQTHCPFFSIKKTGVLSVDANSGASRISTLRIGTREKRRAEGGSKCEFCLGGLQ